MIKIDFKEQYKKQSDDFRRILIENGVVIKTACRATGVHIYMVDYLNQRITLETKSNPESTPEKYQWDIGGSSIAAAQVVMDGKAVLSDQVVGHSLFPNGIPWRPRTRSVLCLPVISQTNACLGILELYREEKDDPFTEDDLSVANVILGWMCAYISNPCLSDGSLQSNGKLLEIHKEVLQEMMASMREDLPGDDVICRILSKIKISMNADYICFCELESESRESKPESCYLYDDGVSICGERILTKKSSKFRFSRELGPMWRALEEGKPINLQHPCKDPAFVQMSNFYNGIKTNSLLAYPVVSQETARGAVTVVNKVNGPCFSLNDEIGFGIWAKCLAVISHYYTKHANLERMAFKSTVMDKLLLMNLEPSDSKIEKSLHSLNHLQIPSDFFSFNWYPSDGKAMHSLAVYMLKDMLDPEVASNDPLLVEFVLTVRSSYRALPYHNFEHAVTVTHCAYIILKRNRDLFDQIEVSAILVSAICHDSDHLGITNSFLVTTNHALSKLYEKSQLENHHYYLAAQFIQELGLFQHLDSVNYGRLMDEIKNNIIGTDLTVFFERRRTIMKYIQMDMFQQDVIRNRSLMKSILMTASDLSATCKPFPVAKKTAEKLCEEYFLQGDKEKELGFCPIGIMNRDLYSRLPEEEVNFYSAITLPCYSLLKQIIPNTEPLYDGCLNAYRLWQFEMEEKNQPMWRVEESYEITEL